MTEQRKPAVGILMGSDSDWPKIQKAAEALAEFGVAYEVRVMSAHRTPQVVADYAATAGQRGLKVIIAAAGGAAHLAGVVAAHTTLPVIGLPVPTPDLGGLDSLAVDRADARRRARRLHGGRDGRTAQCGLVRRPDPGHRRRATAQATRRIQTGPGGQDRRQGCRTAATAGSFLTGPVIVADQKPGFSEKPASGSDLMSPPKTYETLRWVGDACEVTWC